MSLQATPLWTGQQHAWLQALGYTVWVPGSVPAPEVSNPDAPLLARPARPSAPREAVPPAARRPAPTMREDVAPPPPPPPQAKAPMRRSGVRLHDSLRFELIRASGLNPNAPESAAIIASWPDSVSLRGNPTAKRALWPILRALRKAAGE